MWKERTENVSLEMSIKRTVGRPRASCVRSAKFHNLRRARHLCRAKGWKARRSAYRINLYTCPRCAGQSRSMSPWKKTLISSSYPFRPAWDLSSSFSARLNFGVLKSSERASEVLPAVPFLRSLIEFEAYAPLCPVKERLNIGSFEANARQKRVKVLSRAERDRNRST